MLPYETEASVTAPPSRGALPSLEVDLFGVPSAPANLPDWMHYYQTPNKETHNLLYNRAAIYLAPSVIEGWGLTVGEAMMCGQAVVCSDIRGFREILAGQHDDLPESAFLFVGTIDEAIEKAKMIAGA